MSDDQHTLEEHVLRTLQQRFRPLGLDLDVQMRVLRTWGDVEHYGYGPLGTGTDIVQFLPLLQGLEAPLEIDFPFVEMPNGRCASIRVALTDNGGRLILTDDTEEKLRYQDVRQASNETILGAYRRAQAEEALFNEKELAEVTLKSIGDAVIRTNKSGVVTYLNPIAETMTGWSNAEAFGRPIQEVFRVIDGASQQPTLNPILLALAENRVAGLAINTMLLHRSGRQMAIEDSAAPIHDREGRVIGAVLVFHDVSEARAMAVRMTHLAQHDHLTGLPNRVMLQDRVTQAINLAQRHGKLSALLFLDLDRFKNVNDSLGHIVGDKLLQELGRRLKACVRSTDTVSRQGGDEFVVLLSEANQPSDVAHVAEKLLQSISEPCVIEGHDIVITLSIGISIFPDDGNNADTLMKSADAAMYHAKEAGRNNYQFFATAMHEKAMVRQRVETGLRRALRQREFALHYQPKISLETRSIVGLEALVRWQHPTEGLIAPAGFIRIAEECGLISPIGDWVLREACRQNRQWQDAGLLAVPVAVNISAVQFRDKGFVQKIAETLRVTHLAPQYLELELTESVVMQDGSHTTAVLAELRAMGIQLSIDDFGTGYSSLAYLRRFPIDALKIDHSFVHDISTDANDRAIVKAIISMAKSVKQRVIAEGVETAEQMAFLRAEDCDEMQGYLFCKPLPAVDFEHFVRENSNGAGVGGSDSDSKRS